MDYDNIAYTSEEIGRLIVIINDYLSVNRDRFNTGFKALAEFLSSRMYSGVFFNGNVTQAHKVRFLDHMHEHYGYEYYALMFELDLSEMPLHINDGDAGLIARWRLEIAK